MRSHPSRQIRRAEENKGEIQIFYASISNIFHAYVCQYFTILMYMCVLRVNIIHILMDMCTIRA